MNISRLRRYDTSRRQILILLFIIVVFSFLISVFSIMNNSNKDVATISCDSGSHLFLASDYIRFHQFSVQVRIVSGYSCGEGSTYTRTPRIEVFETYNVKIFDSDQSGHSGRVTTNSSLLRIDIEQLTEKHNKYEVFVEMRQFNISKPILYSFISCAGIFFTGMAFTFIYIEKKPRSREQEKIDETSTTIEILENISDKDKVLREIKFLESKLIMINYDQIPEKAICMISKTTFEKDNEIAQCTNCFSCYLKEYIIDWLEKDKHCPVCTAILV